MKSSNKKSRNKIILIISLVVVFLIIVLINSNLPFKTTDPLPQDNIHDQDAALITIASMKKVSESSSILVQGTALNKNGTEIKSVEIQLDNGESIQAIPTKADWSEWSASLDSSVIRDGVHTVTGHVLYNNGESEPVVRPFNYSVNPIVITSPPYDTLISGDSVTVLGTADTPQDTEIKLVELQLDNGESIQAIPTKADWSEWSASLDTSTIDDGAHTITASVVYTNGESELGYNSFNYSTNLIVITNPPRNSLISGDSVTVLGTADTPQDTEIKLVELQLDNGESIQAIPTKADWSEWSASLDTSTIDDGAHTITARVIYDDDEYEWDELQFNYLSGMLYSEMHDDFSDGPYDMDLGTISPNGNWIAMWHDDGYLGVKQDYQDKNNYVLLVESGSVDTLTETKSASVLSTREYKNFKLSVDVRTDKQTRQIDPPNPWEVGWIIWNYKDPAHFNYFVLKPNGGEVGKYDGGLNPVNQKILFTSNSPQIAIGKWSHWEITVIENHVTILVEGKRVFEFDDFSSFDSGKIGFYLEDASVSFDNFSVTIL